MWNSPQHRHLVLDVVAAEVGKVRHHEQRDREDDAGGHTGNCRRSGAEHVRQPAVDDAGHRRRAEQHQPEHHHEQDVVGEREPVIEQRRRVQEDLALEHVCERCGNRPFTGTLPQVHDAERHQCGEEQIEPEVSMLSIDGRKHRRHQPDENILKHAASPKAYHHRSVGGAL